MCSTRDPYLHVQSSVHARYTHWLGTDSSTGSRVPAPAPGTPARKFLPFAEGLARARSLELQGRDGWRAWCKGDGRPADMPAKPDERYKYSGWQGWEHWLGTRSAKPTAAAKDTVTVGVATTAASPEGLLPFDDALARARSLRLQSRDAWRAWSSSGARRADLSASPDKSVNTRKIMGRNGQP